MVSGLDADVQLLHRNGEFYPTNRRHFKAGTMELISPMDRLQSPLRTKSEGWMLVTVGSRICPEWILELFENEQSTGTPCANHALDNNFIMVSCVAGKGRDSCLVHLRMQ